MTLANLTWAPTSGLTEYIHQDAFAISIVAADEILLDQLRFRAGADRNAIEYPCRCERTS
jgi:hypothetical protein